MATYEGGNAEGPPRRHAARFAGNRPAPRVRDHGDAAGRQRRAVRPADRHHLPAAAPPHPGAPQAIESYLAEIAGALPGPARARADIVAELRGGLLDAIDAYRSAGLTDDAA